MPVNTTTTYGSKTYENLVLSHTPTAVFGPYASATNTISDLTNRNFLTASLVTGASFSSQIPFFTLASEQYTFDINASNKIVIKENTASFTKAIGFGNFSEGDQNSNFAVEFLLSKNYDTQSNADFARFGFQNGQHNVGISYSNRANEFYLNVYSQDGYIIHRSMVLGGPSKTSKHIVLNFKKGQPSLYVNGIRSNTIFDNINGSPFFADKVAGRTVAEFSCATNNEHLLVSMISFYNYALNEEAIARHFFRLFDIGDFKNYISTIGAPLLYERISFSDKISRNDGIGQNFYGTDFSNTESDIYLKPTNTPNFKPYGLNDSYLDKVFYSGATGAASTGGFSFTTSDIKNYINTKPLIISFSGTSSGRYTREQGLLQIAGTSVGDIYVGIDSASSKIHIGIGTSSVLAAMSSSISQTASSTIVITSNNSIFSVAYSDGSDNVSYDFSQEILYDNAQAYFFNRYYTSSVTGLVTAVGNQDINFEYAYIGASDDMRVYLSNSFLNSSSNVVWGYQQLINGRANITMPVPSKSQNYFYSTDSSDAIAYSIDVDGSSSAITNESVLTIPSTASSITISASIDGYWNSNVYDLKDNVYIKDVSFYAYPAASYSAGSYPVVLEVSQGLANDQDNYMNIFKQKNIGFIQTASNTLRFSMQDSNFQNIGQVDFLIGIPSTLSATTQYLIDSTSGASMTLTNSSSSYILNFSGITASVNGVAAVSGSTRFLPRQHYFIQASFNSAVASSTYIYMFSASNGNNQFTHSFDRLSVFPSTASNAINRYAQIFGRRTVNVSDNDQNYLQLQSLPDESLLLNNAWQVYTK